VFEGSGWSPNKFDPPHPTCYKCPFCAGVPGPKSYSLVGFLERSFVIEIQRELRRGQAPTLRYCGGSVFGIPERASEIRLGVRRLQF
jgi:hypothetical protein